MNNHQHLPEIDEHTLKLIIGLIAIFLPLLTSIFSSNPLESISASYWDPSHWSRNIFIGFLFAIGAFLLAYNGRSRTEMKLSKIAAFAAIAVAMFPCKCADNPELLPYVHYIAAAVLFGILAVFCYFFLRRAWAKGWAQARVRAVIYGICGFVIVASMALMLADSLGLWKLSETYQRLSFVAESAALIAFGVAWLFASLKLPFVTKPEEKKMFFSF